MNCEMCGKEGPVAPTLLEGTTLHLCEKCGKYGKVLAPPRMMTSKAVVKQPRAPDPTFGIVEDYADRIRRAREKLGLSQKEFAARLNEKESIIHKLETGSHEPPIELARKLEKLLRIALVQEDKDEKVAIGKGQIGGMTIGDLIKNR
jgi:putative transcription factor